MTAENTGDKETLRVLVLEPYYGGSHRCTLDLVMRLPFDFTLMALPPRKWKWRMRLSAPYFAQKLRETGERFDRILCSSYVDVAAFRGYAPPWVREAPLLTYYHENQFAYPVRVQSERDFHFALTNVTTALASDSVAFNSEYNLKTLLDGMDGLLGYAYDMKLKDPRAEIEKRARVLPPPIDFSGIDNAPNPERNDGPPIIVWNHRWEHDKGPEKFFEAIYSLDLLGEKFRIAVLGEEFKERPPVFDRAFSDLTHRIARFGFARDRAEYSLWLKLGDIAVSTAAHEFFGISVLEAVRAGCRPLVPRRLSYPEIFPDEYMYEDEGFLERLRALLLQREVRLAPETARELTEPYSWESLKAAYGEWIEGAKCA